MQVAIIIVTYNAIKWIEKCLENIFRSGDNLNIYIFDNGSSDSTLQLLKKYLWRIHLIANYRNIGFGAANNICIKKAYDDGCKLFLLLNQDVYIRENTISVLAQIINQNPKIGILSPLHLNGNGSELDTNFKINFRKYLSKDELDNINNVKCLYNVLFVNAACWMLTRKIIESTGGFDPLFFHYGEDENYCHRAMYHGFDIAIATHISICHDRDDRGGGIRHEYQQTRHERGWLVKVCNVNNDADKFYKERLYKESLKQVAKAIAKGNLKDAAHYSKLFFQKLNLLRRALQHKKLNRQVCLNWLT